MTEGEARQIVSDMMNANPIMRSAAFRPSFTDRIYQRLRPLDGPTVEATVRLIWDIAAEIERVKQVMSR